MRPHEHISETGTMPEDTAVIARRASAARSRAIGDAIGGATKRLLALASRLMHLRDARLADSFLSRSIAADIDDDAQDAAHWISPKTPLVLAAARSQAVFCDLGTVWITQGDGDDYILKAGEALRLHPMDSVLVNAMAGPALVRHSSQQLSQPPLPAKEHVMTELTLRERELVALGAAMGSNCQPCIEFHIPAARSAGLSDVQISEAIRIADTVRKVPAQKVLHTALSLLPHDAATLQPDNVSDKCAGGSTTGNAKVGCCA